MKSHAAAPVLTMPMPEVASSIDRSVQEIYSQVVQRAYDLFQQRGYTHGNHNDDWFRAEAELLQPAPVHIDEEEDKFVVRAEVPGFRPNQIDVRVEPSRVLITGNTEEQEKQKSRGRTIYSEVRSTRLFRVLALPTEVNPEKAQASVADGILQIVLPKATSRKAVRLELKSSAAAA
jgi:HSP20 family protein